MNSTNDFERFNPTLGPDATEPLPVTVHAGSMDRWITSGVREGCTCTSCVHVKALIKLGAADFLDTSESRLEAEGFSTADATVKPASRWAEVLQWLREAGVFVLGVSILFVVILYAIGVVVFRDLRRFARRVSGFFARFEVWVEEADELRAIGRADIICGAILLIVVIVLSALCLNALIDGSAERLVR